MLSIISNRNLLKNRRVLRVNPSEHEAVNLIESNNKKIVLDSELSNYHVESVEPGN